MMAAEGRFGYPKRPLDVTSSLVLLCLTAPVLVFAAVAVTVTMGMPAVYRDRRVGRGGRPFELLKFRTMRPLRPGESVPESDHARITRVGRVLRRTSIDELPSLINVLRGDMSIVGPRPLPVRYLDRYSTTQARRHEVRPGITGWAQVNGRNSVSWSERLTLDVWYIDHKTLRLDVQIVMMTVLALLRREGISHEGHATMPEFTGEIGERPMA
jgi:sugar transferase EpsL